MKKTVVHFIHDLGRGGAEMMLVKVIKELKDYNNIVVTLSPKNHFENELQCDKYYCLNLRSILFFPLAVLQLKKIITENKVDIVHSHLFWPTFIARLATPGKIPLITTIHAFISNSIEYRKKYMRILDKLTYRLRKNVIVAVADGALEEYFSELNLTPHKAYSLYTFVDLHEINSINETAEVKDKSKVRVVAVGALRAQKNYRYLLEAFKKLKDEDIILDIYGEGNLQNELENTISENDLKINLKGEIKNVVPELRKYDLFVMSSTFEGFSLSVLEAMASQTPLLLSDIKSFREQCADTAVYFNLDDVNDFVSKIKSLSKNKLQLMQIAGQARERVTKNFTLDIHMKGLRSIYQEASTAIA